MKTPHSLGELVDAVYEACVEHYGETELARVAAEVTLSELLTRRRASTAPVAA